MYLRSLALKGFKSFADPTVLDLEPGVTVVVGPNGSGKSNVVDAIAWVLGAQAPSSVRSQKMDDVIFAGTAKRPALGRAEVSLTIDNSDATIPVEFSEVTVTRTLFRTGESEYAINGAPCRLLDVQEILSDSGVGRQQHIIVSQGQIDAVLNARPEERRLIVEEAAGVLKYRKRKEKAQRRLQSTEENLVRIQDLLREVRRQLRPLEKQADAARRHGDLIVELTALRRHLAGRELVALRQRLEVITSTKRDLTGRDAGLKASLATLDTDVLAAEAELSSMGADDSGDALVRFEALRERARGLSALMVERLRGVEREQHAVVNEAVLANLEADLARFSGELAVVEGDLAALQPELEALAHDEAALERDRASLEAQWDHGAVPTTSGAAELRGELGALKAGTSSGEAEVERVQRRLASLEQRSVQLNDAATRLRADIAEASASEPELVRVIDEAETIRREAQRRAERAEADLAGMIAEERSWSARTDALTLALDEARSRAGAEHLAGIPGVLGTLVDLVEVDKGWEVAFEAAVGEALASVVVEDADSGRRALRALGESNFAGAVLALGTSPLRAEGVLLQPDSLRAHVTSSLPEVGALLDALLGDVVVVDGSWSEAIDISLANPGATVVTAVGDRFGKSGWRIGSAGTGATAAALEEARERATAATDAAERIRTELDDLKAALRAAEAAEAELVGRLDDNDMKMSAAGDALQRVETERRDAEVEAEALRGHLEEMVNRVERDRVRIRDLEASLPTLEQADQDALDRGRAMAAARDEIEERAGSVGARRGELDVRRAELGERRSLLERRTSEIEERLSQHVEERAALAARRIDLEGRHTALDRLADLVSGSSESIEAELAILREQRRLQSEAVREVSRRLDALRRDRHAAEAELTQIRELSQRAEIDEAETRMRVEGAVEAIRRDLDCEPVQAIETELPELPAGLSAEARARELERELRIMGPINPLALQEFEALTERHDFLQGQVDDIKATRRELNGVIRGIEEEIVNVFASAFADVASNFEQLFATLFPGGVGRLRLTDPDDLLNTGVEVEAKPSGKNVKKLSLLSGGERSLTALAFLFAVFRSRPSPFYVMDEVEAALDDVNLHRFLGLVEEFRNEAQLIIVSHQKRTMEAADCLYGVSMQPGGSSKVVSEKISAA